MAGSSLQAWERAASVLAHGTPQFDAAIGFDGFVDAIYQIVGPTEVEPPEARFRSVDDFGRYLLGAPGQNSSFALRRSATRIGGNMPIMSNAIGHLGIPVVAVGMVGYPEPDPIFDGMSPLCELVGFADPAVTTALEFENGKLLFAESNDLDLLDWPTIVERVGLDRLRSIFGGRSLIGLVNWSELRNATEIWRGLLDDVLLHENAGGWRPTIVIDLADCSRKSAGQTADLIALMRRYAELGTVILVLNEGEARTLAQRVDGRSDADLVDLCAALYRFLGLHQVVVRNAWEAVACDPSGWAHVPTLHTDTPVVRTGAGDNFNAGYAFAQLHGESLEVGLVLGVALAGHYVRTGTSPSREVLGRFLLEQGERRPEHSHKVAAW